MKHHSEQFSSSLFPALVALVLSFSIAQASDPDAYGILTGRIFSAAQSRPLAAAYVYLEGTDLWSYTDLNGVYRIEDIQPGTYTVVASINGYGDEKAVDITIPGRRIVEVDMRMKKGADDGEAGILYGNVVHAQNGKPLQNVNVQLEGTDYKTSTDSSGAYGFPSVTAGTFSLIAKKLWFDAFSATDVSIQEGKGTQFDFKMQPRFGEDTDYEEPVYIPRGAISGAVFDVKTRRPLAAANVYLENTDYFDFTGPSGVFVIRDVPQGIYKLAIALTGYEDTRISNVEIIPDTLIHMRIPLSTTGGNASLGEIASMKFGTIAGTIVDEDNGRFLPGANVMLEGTGFSAITDETGAFTFDSLVDGNYTLVALLKGYDAIARTGLELDRGDTLDLRVDLQKRIVNTADIDEYHKRPATITGKFADEMSGEPLQDIIVFLKGTDFSDTTDAEGFYSLEKVLPAPGSYLLCGYKKGYDTLCRRDIHLLPQDIAIHNFELSLIEQMDSATVANRGKLTGTIVDEETQEPLLGAKIELAATRYQGVTDFKGEYSIVGLRGKTYSATVTHEGYASKGIEEIDIQEGETTTLSIELEQSDISEMQRMVVQSKANRNTGAVLLKERQSAISFTDAVGSQEMSRMGASDAADAMKSVTGASVVGGRYVIIRGLPEKYSLVMLNGSPLPSPDPDRKAVNMDMFPAAMIENITTYKTFTPDLPGEWAGGVVDIITKPFPEELYFSAKASGSYNDRTTFNEKFISYQGGNLDWLGIDDGTRDLPDIFAGNSKADIIPYHNAQGRPVENLAPDSPTLDSLFFNEQLATSLDTIQAITRQRALPDQSYSLAFGNTFSVMEKPLGIVSAISYKNSNSLNKNGLKKDYTFSLPGTPEVVENRYKVTEGDNKVIWSILGSGAFKLNSDHILSVNYFYVQNTIKNAGFLDGIFGYYDKDKKYLFQRLSFKERFINFIQPYGSHAFRIRGIPLNLKWKASFTGTAQNEPDIQEYNHFYFPSFNNQTGYDLEANVGEPNHQWRNLKENAGTFGVEIAVPFYQWSDDSGTVKAGGGWRGKERERTERMIEYQLQRYFGVYRSQHQGDPVRPADLISRPHLGIIEDATTTSGYSSGLFIKDESAPEAQWKGNSNLFAAFAMAELPLLNRLSLTAGLRYERARFQGQSFGEDIGVISEQGIVSDSIGFARLDDHDFLPAVSLTYKFDDDLIVRGSYARTLIRPSMREKANYREYTYQGGETFVGNPELKRFYIDNVDLRWEWFINPGELLAVSAFYKSIHEPIELNFLLNEQLTPINTREDVDLAGLEIEMRKRLDFIDLLKNFQIASNFTFSFSRVELDTSAVRRSAKNENYFPDEELTRPFQGQSPIVFNAFLIYDNPDIGLNSTLFFNVFGTRMSDLTDPDKPWEWEKPQPIMNISISKKVWSDFKVKLSAKNMLNSKKLFVHQYQDSELITEKEKTGVSYSMGISYEF
ncbi:MAG: TonB-dependent receptor plug domain-containing protein [Chitinivibrionales bacterium]|nr:TonB-dependent receptor plug domain-containing protein [Chitinivibrionales bacterium]